ncbi:MAG: aminopeptidase [Bacteroidaceae bacterium]|nr:aminopeptidase [Bacteroidaceae bacterium]
MRRISLAFAFATAVAGCVSAQNISDEMMEELRGSWAGSASDRAIQNVVTANAFSALIKNHANVGEADMKFTHEVPSHGISNQKSSGRCWLFTGMNVLQSLTLDGEKTETAKGLKEVNFSHVYLSFHDLLEKSNLFLQSVIDMRKADFSDRRLDYLLRNPIGDGGTFTGVADLVEKYGLVPSDVMPETYQSENTASMLKYIKTTLRRAVPMLRKDPSKKAEVLKSVYRILVLCCGEPPREFTWKGKRYTPQAFRDSICPRSQELRDYVMIVNDPLRPYYKMYDIDLARHMYDGHNWRHLNLPWAEMAEAAIRSIKDSTAMYFSCDVGKELDRVGGRLDLRNFDVESLLGVEFGMPKDEAMLTFESASSHAMTLVGVAMEEEKPVRWKIENSWGSTGASGHLVATDEWMEKYAYRLVVHKKYLDEKTRQMTEQKPVQLPAWDYLN